MNLAERFLAAFPHAAQTNGWTKDNLTRMVRDATTLGISGDEFQAIVDRLLRTPRRTSVPPYSEVYGAMLARKNERAAQMPDSTVQRLRESRAEYRPWTDTERAWRREVVVAMREGRTAPTLAEFRNMREAMGGVA
jgi:hypothetical protein